MATPPGHAPAQVGAGGAAPVANRADWLALRDPLAGHHVLPGLVQVHADQALTVVDQREPPLEVHIRLGHDHQAGCGGADRRAVRRGEVDAVVRRLGDAVVDALRAEGRGADRPRQGRDEAGGEAVARVAGRQRRRLALQLCGDARQERGVGGRHLVVRQAVDALHGVGDRRDVEAPRVPSPRAFDGDRGSRRRIAVPADHGEAVGSRPRLDRVIDPHPRARGRTQHHPAALPKVPRVGGGRGGGGPRREAGRAREAGDDRAAIRRVAHAGALPSACAASKGPA